MRPLVMALALALFGCAREWVPAREAYGPRYDYAGYGPAPLEPYVGAAPAGEAAGPSSWGQPTNGAAGAPWPATPVLAAPRAHAGNRGVGPALGASIPPGRSCLSLLDRLGVDYRPLVSLKGVQTPIEVGQQLGPVRFYPTAGRPLTCDCRLAVALAWTGRHLAEFGIRDVGFSGAYVDRTTRSGRPSRHARGLAIDLHFFGTAEQKFNVKRDFARGLADSCAPQSPLVNRIACRLHKLGLYKELLTPDSDRDHHDHIHVALAPLD